jgi:hypothetical protein
MSWLFSQALVEEYLGENFSDGEQSAPLSGKPIQQAYCAPDKMMDFSRLSRFGMTFKPLTENLGEELLTLYLEGFHAKTSAQLEKAQELMENEVECGEKWHGSFVKFDLSSSLWKTHQCSLLGDLEEFSQTWPQWGLMRNGECWEQLTLEQTIRGIDFGWSGKWPTPVSSDTGLRKTKYKQGGTALSLAIQTWPTPDANCGQRGTQPNWTPKRKSGHSAQYTINQAVRDSEQGIGGKLNPMWVEWLMGWPLGWTDLKPLEMDKSHFVLQPHGES